MFSIFYAFLAKVMLNNRIVPAGLAPPVGNPGSANITSPSPFKDHFLIQYLLPSLSTVNRQTYAFMETDTDSICPVSVPLPVFPGTSVIPCFIAQLVTRTSRVKPELIANLLNECVTNQTNKCTPDPDPSSTNKRFPDFLSPALIINHQLSWWPAMSDAKHG